MPDGRCRRAVMHKRRDGDVFPQPEHEHARNAHERSARTRLFSLQPRAPSSDELYECRVWPPDTVEDDDGAARLVFPLTLAEMWCGQFARKVN